MSSVVLNLWLNPAKFSIDEVKATFSRLLPAENCYFVRYWTILQKWKCLWEVWNGIPVGYLQLSVILFNDSSPHSHPNVKHKLKLSCSLGERFDSNVASGKGWLQIIENHHVMADLGQEQRAVR